MASTPDIPFVLIAYNNLTFVRNFIQQLLRFPHRIIILDNASTYPALLTYYDEIEKLLGDRILVHRLSENYGHNVYQKRTDLLPQRYILSDPDLQLHSEMPLDVDQVFLRLSQQYEAYKVGSALDLADRHLFISCPNYSCGQGIADFESQYWQRKINHPTLELYAAPIDTTFCLVNRDYEPDAVIRVAGVFTAKHLPWYKDYIKQYVPAEEIEHWKRNNISSSILFTCLNL